MESSKLLLQMSVPPLSTESESRPNKLSKIWVNDRIAGIHFKIETNQFPVNQTGGKYTFVANP